MLCFFQIIYAKCFYKILSQIAYFFISLHNFRNLMIHLYCFRKEDVPVSPHPSEIGLSYPRADIAFKILLTARFCSAIWSNISDCDETYNFWEPVSLVVKVAFTK